MASSELEQPFVAEQAYGSERGIGVDAENGGEIFGGWEALSGFRFAVCDRASDLGGNLFVQIGGVASVDLDIEHGASHISVTVLAVQS